MGNICYKVCNYCSCTSCTSCASCTASCSSCKTCMYCCQAEEKQYKPILNKSLHTPSTLDPIYAKNPPKVKNKPEIITTEDYGEGPHPSIAKLGSFPQLTKQQI